jgi:hypothetical protein
MNKFLYLVIEKPSKHFVYNNHVVKELSAELKNMGIDAVITRSERLQLRLKFYKIEKDYKVNLERLRPSMTSKNVTISYVGVKVAEFYVTNLYK